MEFPELAKLAFSRVQKVEPENVGKILGCILLREPDEEEMVQLAYSTDAELFSIIADAKATLAAIYARCSAHQIGTTHSRGAVYHPATAAGVRHSSPATTAFGYPAAQPYYWPAAAADTVPPVMVHQQDYTAPQALVDPAVVEGHHYAFQNQNGGADDPRYVDGYNYYAAAAAEHHGGGGRGAGGLQLRASSRRANGGLSSSTRRPCHYFFRGLCKNGHNCHYSHRHQQQVASSAADGPAAGGDEHQHHNTNAATPGVLETLEMEITELLNSRRGQPVSIASLPTLYGEKYGKGLQADGYLTESQRHGKAGYSLTKLLSRLNKIRVIERPHGQHSVVLAEDAAKYTHSSRTGDMSPVPASSHQIYLTFPAESIFTEEDVANYFGQYGPVRDVRIPCQERRMFGFVSFQSADTVSAILTRRNPHFICGSRVLVKPYREKSKCVESYHPRSYVDKIKPMHYLPAATTRFFEVDPEVYPKYDASSRLMRKHLADKRERLLELERKRFAGMRLESIPPQFAYFDCSIGDVHPVMNNSVVQGAESKDDDLMDDPIGVPDALEIVSTSQAPQWQTSNDYDDQESNQVELLPESPFASVPSGNNISAVI